MAIYKIADLVTEMECIGRTYVQSQPYRSCSNNQTVQIQIDQQQERARLSHIKHPEMGVDDWEYMLTASSFYRQLIGYQGMLLHASAVCYRNGAYLFSAPCGTGKSTHTSLWLEKFGPEAFILNDDKPALRYINEKFYVYGTPWSGKYDASVNMRVPLQGICFLQQAPENRITPMAKKDALVQLLHQTIRKINQEQMIQTLDLIHQLLETIQIYQMGCTISKEAVQLSYHTMKERTHED